MKQIVWALVLCVGGAASAWGQEQGALEEWNRLLETYVTAEGWVDYAGLREREREALAGVIEEFAREDPAEMTVFRRKAYWINVYNAVTVQAIVESYPLDSIKDLNTDEYNVWQDYGFGPERVSLNDIEHEILRPMGDPRIHAAIVCASRGCPPLRNQAYGVSVPGGLNGQLEDQCRRWINDPERGAAVRGGVVYLSAVFEWFGEDFAGDARGRIEWARRYAEGDLERALDPSLPVRSLDWDWSLNAQ